MAVSKVEIEELQGLADQVRRAHSSVEAGKDGLANAPVPNLQGTAFGNTPVGPNCLRAAHDSRVALGAALEAFSTTVDSDTERLTTALRVYQQTDAENADKFLEANRNRLDVLSTHLTKTDEPEHKQVQVDQINRLGQLTGDNQNTVIGGDFNAVQDTNNAKTPVANSDQPSYTNKPEGQAFGNLGRQGYDTDAGFLTTPGDTGKYGTSITDSRIDHLMPRGVGANDATRWAAEDKESDHDGIVVDVRMPNW
jgi:exonuclease III